ncbi:UNVERIFIED_CONTAM: hypothetical protein FKN15_052554 [Acipenser sinensis]
MKFHQVSDLLNQKARNVYRMPAPTSCSVNSSGEPVNLRIPPPLPFTETPLLNMGLSFLELRYQLLLLYLQDLTHLLLKKVEGRSLRGDSGIERLLELRTVLEKMRPIDQKLKYQIDKLVRTAVTGTLGTGEDEADRSETQIPDRQTGEDGGDWNPRLTVQPPQSYSVGGQRSSGAAYRQARRRPARPQGALVSRGHPGRPKLMM